MNALRRLNLLPARLALLVVLLLAQGLLLAHEVDHLSAGESTSLCAVCKVGHGLDSPAVSAPAAEIADDAADVVFTAPERVHAAAPRPSRHARAPPTTLSH